jgi:hypothetical protein
MCSEKEVFKFENTEHLTVHNRVCIIIVVEDRNGDQSGN